MMKFQPVNTHFDMALLAKCIVGEVLFCTVDITDKNEIKLFTIIDGRWI